MSVEENKQLVMRFYEEVWNQGRFETVHELVANTEGRYDHGKQGQLTPENQALVASGIRRLFPDVHMTVEVLFGEGEMVAARWRMSGTHVNGTRIENYTGVNIFRVQDGKFVEIRNNRDDLGLLEQMGIVAARDELWKKLSK